MFESKSNLLVSNIKLNELREEVLALALEYYNLKKK